MDEKVLAPQIDSSVTSDSILSSLSQSPLVSPLRNVYLAYCDRRRALGLSNPGTVEDLSKEVSRNVFLNNHMFSGFRADFTKVFSMKPMFQTAHNFAMGSQVLPPYSFAALYGTSDTFLQANLDSDFSLSARANYRWSSGFVTKSNVQLQPPGSGSQSMLQVEGEYTGDDFNASLKVANPSILEDAVTGIFVGQYLQSVTPGLALGLEAMWQKAGSEEPPQSTLSYCAKYKAQDWIAAAQVAPPIGLQLSYWRRLAERVEAGVELNLQFLGLSGASMMGSAKNEGTGTFGVKYDFRTSAFRGQVDSAGKVSACIEKRIAPTVQLTFAGEMDHPKNQSKIGLAVSVESAGQDDEAAEKMQQAAESMPNTPF